MTEHKNVKLPIPMDVSQRTEGQTTSIACPSCGAGAAFGQGGCAYCGSGLLKNEITPEGRFGLPNNSRQWKVGEDFSPDEHLNSILKKMEEQTPEGEYSYVMWRDRPALVGGGIDAKKSYENYKELGKEISREKLGKKWTRTLDLFHNLQTDLHSLDDELRLDLAKRHRANFHPNAFLPDDAFDFFEEPTFKNFEKFMSTHPMNGDEADFVREGIGMVRKYIVQSSESKTSEI
jgi:hypothetical protein